MNQSALPLLRPAVPLRAAPGRRPRTFYQKIRRAFAAAMLPPFPGTKDISLHPAFLGALSRAAWKFGTHRITRSGAWFFALTLVLISVGTPTLEIQAYIPLLYVIALWLFAFAYVPFARPKVELRMRCPNRIQVGETLTMDVEVRQIGRRRGVDQVILPWRLHPSMDALQPDGVGVPPLRQDESAHVGIPLRCSQRGVYPLRGLRVSSDYPFGLVNAYRIIRIEQTLLVYPHFEPLLQVTVPHGAGEGVGDNARLLRRGESFDLLGNREYRQGDNIRNIDWRATARLGSPILREWREEHSPRIAVLLDTVAPDVLDELDFRRQADSGLERAVSLCAAICDALMRQDEQIELLTIGEETFSLVGEGTDDRNYQILERLARAEARDSVQFLSDTVCDVLLRQYAQVNGAILLLLDWDAERSALAEQLRQRGIGVKVVLVRDTPPALPPPPDVRVITRANTPGIREI